MKRNNFLWGASILFTLGAYASSPLYLAKITNQTDNTLFKAWVPNEQYDVIIFPNSTAKLEQWFNFHTQKNIMISPQKGDGELPIFVEYGPEPSIQCNEGMMPHSLIYWQGSQSTSNENKSYQAYCQDGKAPEVELIIKPDFTVEIVPLNNVKKEAEL